MKIATEIQLANGVYNAQIGIEKWSAVELEKMCEFGEPTVDIGGTITGSATRPGTHNTTVTISGGGGTGATATPVITNGVITGFIVTAGGSSYGSAPAVAIAGDGTGASGTAVVSGNAVVSITLVAGGTGYHVAPVPVSMTFPSCLRRIRTDFPVKRVFDLADDVNADVMASVYVAHIVALLTDAKTALVAQTATFEGESATTV